MSGQLCGMLIVFVACICCAFVGAVTLDANVQIARFDNNRPDLFLIAKNPTTDEIHEEDWMKLEFLAFQEKTLCYCCRATTLGPETINCNDEYGLGELVNLSNKSWTLIEDTPNKTIRWVTSLPENAELTIGFEVIESAANRSMSNGLAERTLTLDENSLKFTVTINNYTATLPQNDTFNSGLDANVYVNDYFGLAFYLRFSFPREIFDQELIGPFSILSPISEFQPALLLRTKDAPWVNVTLVQTSFSVADPPAGSMELLDDSDFWGFENVDAVLRDYLFEDGIKTGITVETIFAGATDVVYDPNLSIVTGVNSDNNEEDDETLEDGVIIGVTVGVIGAVLLLVLILIAGVVVASVIIRKRRTPSVLRKSVGFGEDEELTVDDY